MVPTTVFVAGSITETLFCYRQFVTYKNPLSGLKATPTGLDPTGMVAITVFVVPSITETLLLRSFATYKNPLSGLKAILSGCTPTGMVATTVFDRVYHRDAVTGTTGICHVHKAVVWVEGNANWMGSHGYGAHNRVCRAVYHRDGVAHCRLSRT